MPANFLGTTHKRQVSLDFVPLPLSRSVCPCLSELGVSLGEERHGGTWHPLRLTKAPVIGPNPRIYGCGRGLVGCANAGGVAFPSQAPAEWLSGPRTRPTSV